MFTSKFFPVEKKVKFDPCFGKYIVKLVKSESINFPLRQEILDWFIFKFQQAENSM